MASVASRATSAAPGGGDPASTPARSPPSIRCMSTSPSAERGRPRRHEAHKVPPSVMSKATSGPSSPQEAHASSTGLAPSRSKILRKKAGATIGCSRSASSSTPSARTKVSTTRGSAWPSCEIWSTTSSIESPALSRSRSSRIDQKRRITSTWLIVASELRPCQNSTWTWVSGSRRDPKRDPVLRTPLATARTLPCDLVISTTIRSASPSW